MGGGGSSESRAHEGHKQIPRKSGEIYFIVELDDRKSFSGLLCTWKINCLGMTRRIGVKSPYLQVLGNMCKDIYRPKNKFTIHVYILGSLGFILRIQESNPMGNEQNSLIERKEKPIISSKGLVSVTIRY